MSNPQITSQLTRVTVPSISNGNFAEGIRNAFETINNNFKNIASLPFIQGVQGDSYTLISKDIWVEVNDTVSPIYYALTKEGAVLLNSIFESHLDKVPDVEKFHEGDSFEKCKNEKLGTLSLKGVSPIDSFFTEENGVVKPINNKLYFYSIINNLNEEQDTYLGQYFYFIDYRITELGNVYQDEKLSEFIDFTGFYQYQPASETVPEKYSAISIVPNLYYDKDKDDICWKYNGQETGISAMGPKGLDGKDANFKIVYVQYINETDNSGDILAVGDLIEYYDPEKDTIVYVPVIERTDILENCFCLVQFVDAVVNEDNTVTIITYHDSAFGEVHENKVYWQNSLKIGKLFNNQNITKYFCNMGTSSTSIENHPYYLAIPSNLDRRDATIDDYKVGHVFSSSEDGNLILQKANNAFTTEAGQTSEPLTPNGGTQNEFNIKNYNVSIGKNLSVGGTLGVTGEATIGSDLSVGGTLGVTGVAKIGSDLHVSGSFSVSNSATIKNGATIYGKSQIGSTGLEVHGGLNGIGASIEGGRSRTSVGCTGLVVNGGLPYGSNPKRGLGIKVETGGVEISDHLSVGGTLSVTGKATLNNDLSVSGTLDATNATIGTLDVTNDATINTLDVTGATIGTLDVTNDATVGGTLDATNANIGTLGVTGDATVGGTLSVTSDVHVHNNLNVTASAAIGTLGVAGAALFGDNVYVDGTLGVTGDATVGGTLGVTGDATVGGTLGVTGDATVGGTLGVTGDATVGGTLSATNIYGNNCRIINSTKYGYSNNTLCLEVKAGKSISQTDTGVTGASIIGGEGASYFNETRGSDGGVGLIISGGQGGKGANDFKHALVKTCGVGGTGLIVSGGVGGTGIDTKGEIEKSDDGDAILATGNVNIKNGTLYIDNDYSDAHPKNIHGLKIETSYKGDRSLKYANEFSVTTLGHKTDSDYYKKQAENGKTTLYLKGGSGSQNSGIVVPGEWTVGGVGGVGLEVHGGDGGNNFIGQDDSNISSIGQTNNPSIDVIKSEIIDEYNSGSIGYAHGGIGIIVKAGFPGNYALGYKTGGTSCDVIGTEALMGRAIDAYGDIYINEYKKDYTIPVEDSNSTTTRSVGSNGSLHTDGFVNSGKGFIGLGCTAYISNSTYNALDFFTSDSNNEYAYFKEAYSNIMNNGYGKGPSPSDTRKILVFTNEIYKGKGLVIYYQMASESVNLFSARDPSKGNKAGHTTVTLKRGVYFIFLGSSFTYKLKEGHTAVDLYHIVDVTGNMVWSSGSNESTPSWAPLYPSS